MGPRQGRYGDRKLSVASATIARIAGARSRAARQQQGCGAV